MLLNRNIPAHAGKTIIAKLTPSRAAEHPRARGENNLTDGSVAAINGTSPRTRGKLRGTLNINLSRRNIPAHAGKTWLTAKSSMSWAEHPRARGENYPGVRTSNVDNGTSPRTRGKPFPVTRIRTRERNIPAHAGKTNWILFMRKSPAEHPRARGENPGRVVSSAPRVRNIPAHAGKTTSPPAS